MDQIMKAHKAHASISSELYEYPILFNIPDKIFHNIKGNDYISLLFDDSISTEYKFKIIYLAKHFDCKLSQCMRDEEDVRMKWFDFAHHNLLFDMMAKGILPVFWPEGSNPNEPRSVAQVLKKAKQHGYAVPEEFLRNDSTSYSEVEAYHAASQLIRAHHRQPYWNNEIYIEDIKRFRNKFCQLTGQFIVPDPTEKNKTPYVLDQLWIVYYPELGVRLVGLEIDGEVHLTEKERIKTKKRDNMLAAMGYEIYHVAGWWCRIDPYRVICEFLSASDLLPNAHNYLIGATLRNIDDYYCSLCGGPMVRWDDDWIRELSMNEKNITVHKQCYEKFIADYE